MKLSAIYESGYTEGDRSIWKHPDLFYCDQGTATFVYSNGQLYITHDIGMTHADLMEPIYGRSSRLQRLDNNLEGRVSCNGEYVSFWNHRPQHYTNLVQCLKALLDSEVINADTIVCTPIAPEFKVQDAAQQEFVAPNSDTTAKIEQQRQLHLLRGAEKKQALMAAGAKPRGPHPNSLSLVGAGVKTPGQKWWAVNSEHRSR